MVGQPTTDHKINPDPFKYLGKPYKDLTNALTATYPLPITHSMLTHCETVGMAYLNGSSDLKVSECLNGLSIKLLRAFAKVDIGVGKYNEKNNTWSNSGPGKIPFELVSVETRSIRKDAQRFSTSTKRLSTRRFPPSKRQA